MSLSLAKIILSGSNVVTNTAGAYFQNANLTVNTAGVNANIVIPAGLYYANTPANCSIYANLGSATNVAVLGATTAGLVLSDGVNVYANTTTNGTVVMVTVNGGEAATGTYLS
jgi:hypothetical protein